MNEYITMSAKETERVKVMEDLMAKRVKQKQAAKVLGLSGSPSLPSSCSIQG